MNIHPPKTSWLLIAFFLSVLGGCASDFSVAQLKIPVELSAPSEQALYLESYATGVQIYECTSKTNAPNLFEWTFRAPEAVLTGDWGHVIGKHYAGPTWEFLDGSTIVGEVKARSPAPDQRSIPWLLLTSKSNTGSGVFSHAKSIQRVHTSGGQAPKTQCYSADVGQIVRVPYAATYYFYRTKSAY
jgi:hypothetical protein